MLMLSYVHANTAFYDNNTKFDFPKLIADFSYKDKREYKDEELGYSLSYYSKGAVVDVYIFNYGLNDIKDGISGKHVLSIHSAARKDVQTMVELGYYKSATEILDLNKFLDVFLKSSYYITKENSLKIRSHIFTRGQNGYFVKVRASSPVNMSEKKFDKKVGMFLKKLLVIIN